VELVHRVVGPAGTNLYVLADPATRQAIAVDTAIPSVAWLADALDVRGWSLTLIVSTHGHWDHIGDNAAVAAHTGAPIAVHAADRAMLEHPAPLFAPFPIPPSVPAMDLAEGGRIVFGSVVLDVLHTPGHTPGSVCLAVRGEATLISGDTLFAGGPGRVDLPGGDPGAMVASLARLARLDPSLRVLPGHGPSTTIADEQPWIASLVRAGSGHRDFV
jgi:glyoxylase-like metal-dependent hydrolase (beta-lactamase superfamily II)